MRKDVKLAFIVGGILISVLVVYVLVVPGGPQKRASNQPVQLDTKPGDAKPGKTETAAAPENKTDSKPTNGEKVAQKDEKPAEVASAGPATKPTDPFEDKWAMALTSGTVPPMMTAAPPAPGPAVPSLSGKSHTETPKIESAKNGSPKIEPAKIESESTKTEPPKAETPKSAPQTLLASPGTSISAPPTVLAPEPATQPTVVADPPPAAGTRTHVIQKGETIAKIAETVYGSQNYWPHIIRANPGIVAEKIRPGMTINLPPESEVKPAAGHGASSLAPTENGAKPASATIDPNTQYEVQSGDSLAKIAMKLYGNGNKWQAIYDLNKEAIGNDPAKVKVKSVLKLPEPPTQKQ